MTTNPSRTQTVITLRLSKRAYSRLTRQAKNSGKDPLAVACDLLERAVIRPTTDELLAPFREQVAQSGMSNAKIDALFREEIKSHRRKNKGLAT